MDDGRCYYYALVVHHTGHHVGAVRDSGHGCYYALVVHHDREPHDVEDGKGGHDYYAKEDGGNCYVVVHHDREHHDVEDVNGDGRGCCYVCSRHGIVVWE